jgi:hypothetical protein
MYIVLCISLAEGGKWTAKPVCKAGPKNHAETINREECAMMKKKLTTMLIVFVFAGITAFQSHANGLSAVDRKSIGRINATPDLINEFQAELGLQS